MRRTHLNNSDAPFAVLFFCFTTCRCEHDDLTQLWSPQLAMTKAAALAQLLVLRKDLLSLRMTKHRDKLGSATEFRGQSHGDRVRPPGFDLVFAGGLAPSLCRRRILLGEHSAARGHGNTCCFSSQPCSRTTSRGGSVHLAHRLFCYRLVVPGPRRSWGVVPACLLAAKESHWGILGVGLQQWKPSASGSLRAAFRRSCSLSAITNQTSEPTVTPANHDTDSSYCAQVQPPPLVAWLTTVRGFKVAPWDENRLR